MSDEIPDWRKNLPVAHYLFDWRDGTRNAEPVGQKSVGTGFGFDYLKGVTHSIPAMLRFLRDGKVEEQDKIEEYFK